MPAVAHEAEFLAVLGQNVVVLVAGDGECGFEVVPVQPFAHCWPTQRPARIQVAALPALAGVSTEQRNGEWL